MVGAARLKIGLEAQRAARERDFRPITDQVAGLRADMEALRRSPLIHPECKIYGEREFWACHSDGLKT